jgi:hypothetical protein
MKNFAICLFLLNLLYLSWNMGYLPGSDNSAEVIIREPNQQAPQSLILLSEMDSEQLLETAIERADIERTDIERTDIERTAEITTEPTRSELFPQPALEVEREAERLSCLAIGDFEDISVSNALVAELRQQGLQARVELQEQTESEYRVYMPPFSSDTAARQTLANLLSNGIDSFLITTGDLAQGISLGVFSQQVSAFTLQEELASEGYATNVQETILSNTEFWIVIRAATSSELEALWLTLLNSRPSLKQSENLCQIIAPED